MPSAVADPLGIYPQDSPLYLPVGATDMPSVFGGTTGATLEFGSTSKKCGDVSPILAQDRLATGEVRLTLPTPGKQHAQDCPFPYSVVGSTSSLTSWPLTVPFPRTVTG